MGRLYKVPYSPSLSLRLYALLPIRCMTYVAVFSVHASMHSAHNTVYVSADYIVIARYFNCFFVAQFFFSSLHVLHGPSNGDGHYGKTETATAITYFFVTFIAQKYILFMMDILLFYKND